MSSKEDGMFLKQHHSVIDHYHPDKSNQFSNLNLNQSQKCLDTALSNVQSLSKSNTEKRIVAYRKISGHNVPDNYKVKDKTWNKSAKNLNLKALNNPISIVESSKEDVQKRWMNEKKDGTKNKNSSTLSLHIAAYESSIEADSKEAEEDMSELKPFQGFTKLQTNQDLFEFPRQMEGRESLKPEIQQFLTSQKLFAPDQSFSSSQMQPPTDVATIKKTMPTKRMFFCISKAQFSQSERMLLKHVLHRRFGLPNTSILPTMLLQAAILNHQICCKRFAGTDSSSSKDGENKSKNAESPNKYLKLEKDEEVKKITQPSYLGYLSRVISSALNPLQEMLPTMAKAPPQRVVPIAVKRASREEVTQKTDTLVKKFLLAESTQSRILRIEELNRHLMNYPASRLAAIEKTKLIPSLLKFRAHSPDEYLKEESRQCLALLGYCDPPHGGGVRVLSIDGGGTRGILGLEVLGQLEKEAGNKKICELFDIIIGVSTGAILSVLLGAKRKTVEECKSIYLDLSRQLFNQGRLSGVSGLLMSHSYYNSKKWVEILKNVIGADTSVISTARNPKSPKLAIISSIVNAPQLQPYIFRNYEHPAGRDSHFRGGTKNLLYEAVQCSSAAPGYFSEVPLGTIVHQDGGVLVNNPTAIAIHEARQLWPNEKIQCVVSVGNGRSVAELELTAKATATRIQDKISKIVDSATDTELVHLAMTDLLPPDTYFRLNPYMTFPYTLDEIDPDKLLQMRRDSLLYVRRNRNKISLAAEQLAMPPTILQKSKRVIFDLRAHWGKYKV